MENRLQFVHNDTLFATRDQAIKYVEDAAVITRPSLYAEPVIVKYGTEDNINVILGIGANGDGVTQDFGNKYFFIDTARLDEDIAALKKTVSEEGGAISGLTATVDKLIEGLGLNEDGTYTPDEADPILSGATNLNDATVKLSEAVQAIQKAIVFTTTDTVSVTLTSSQDENGIQLSAEVNVPERVVTDTEIIPNIIQVVEDGLFVNVELDYNEESGLLTFTNGISMKELNLPLDTHLVDGVYEAETEELVLTLNRPIDIIGTTATTQSDEIRIPMGELAHELETGRKENSPVILTIEVNENGKSIIYGDVEIHPSDNNILQLHGNALYVKGTADNIKYDDTTTVKDKIDEITVSVKNTSTVNLTKEDGVISADVNLSQDGTGNIIVKHAGGLYANVDLNYEPSSGVLTFTNGIGSGKTFTLTMESFLKSGYYDSNSEEIVLIFATQGGTSEQSIRIPVANLITEWTVGRRSDSVVILEKTRTAGAGPDVLYADVAIYNSDTNILSKNGGALFVDGRAAVIKYDDKVSVYQKITENTAAIETNKTAIETEATRAKAEEARLATLIETNTSASTSACTTLINEEKQRALAAEEALQKAIDAEETRATNAETQLQTNIDTAVKNVTSAYTATVEAEKARAEKAEGELTTKYDSLKEAVDNIHLDVSGDIQTAVEAEKNRAEAAEQANAKAIADNATKIATNLEKIEDNSAAITANTASIQTNAQAIAAEADRAKAEEEKLVKAIEQINSASTENIQKAVEAEKVRAEGVEAQLSAAIEANKESIATNAAGIAANTASITANTQAITAEQARAEKAEQANAAAIETEKNRATSAEATLQTNIDTAVKNVTSAYTALVETEKVRAEAAEQANAKGVQDNKSAISIAQEQIASLLTDLSNEVARAQSAETVNAGAISAEATRAKAEEKRIEGIVTTNGVLTSAATNDIRALEKQVVADKAELSAYTTSAITIAADDATTKANNAKSDAVTEANTYTDNQIKTVNQSLTTILTEAKTYADTQDAAVKTEINKSLSDLSGKTLVATGDAALTLTGGKDGDGNYTLSGEVKLSAGQNNLISKVGDGLLANIDLSYTNGQLTLSGNNGFSKTVDIAINGLIENVQRVGNALVFTFKKEDGSTEQITIDLEDLISDWEPLNDHLVDGKQISVDLTKLAPASGESKSKLYANVKMYDGDGHTTVSAPTHNILSKEASTGRLFVEGTSESIYHNGAPMSNIITNITQEITNITTASTEAIDRTIISGSYDKDDASLTLNRQDGTAIVIPGIETNAASVIGGTVTADGKTLNLSNSDGSVVSIDVTAIITAATAGFNGDYTGVATDSCTVTVDNVARTISVDVATIDCGEY